MRFIVDKSTYIHILADTLIKKNVLLDNLLRITDLQVKYLNTVPPEMEKFEQAMGEKDDYIEQINQIDEGFEMIYLHVQEELNTKRIEHKEQIEELQELIRQITDKSAKIQGVEMRNRNWLETYFQEKRKEIKNLKISNRTVTNYYKNMQNSLAGESFFLDKKK